MNAPLAAWIDKMLDTEIPEQVAAFCFNLYEEGDGQWSMEIIGSEWFDLEDEDWACNELTDFDSRNDLYVWEMDCGWEDALAYMVAQLKEYLENGRHAPILKSKTGVGVGFVDGNLEILHSKE